MSYKDTVIMPPPPQKEVYRAFPTISVIVASYNYEPYIRRNLDSLVNQTYNNYEIIVVDDGSSDNSVEIIKEYEKKYDNLKYFEHENHANKGLTESILLALKHAKGDYIAFCESDDYWTLNHLQKKAECIKKFPKSDLIINPPHIFGDEASVKNYRHAFYPVFYKLSLLKKPENMFIKLIGTTFPTFSCIMVRKSKLEQTNFDCPIKNGLDIWLWKQLDVHCKIMFVNEILTYWYKHESNAGKAIKKEFADLNVDMHYYYGKLDKFKKYTLWQHIFAKNFYKYYDKYIYHIRLENDYIVKRILGIEALKKKINTEIEWDGLNFKNC